MALDFAAAPVRDPIAVEDQKSKKLMLPRVWIDWFTALTLRVDESALGFAPVELENQNASIGSTSLPLDTLSAGVYRISYYARITTAATTSSSLTVSFGATDSGVGVTFTGSAITGNTVSTVQSGTFIVRSDQAAPITYATVYASVGATAMVYRLDIVVEQLV
jgi:hypothetical protein